MYSTSILFILSTLQVYFTNAGPVTERLKSFHTSDLKQPRRRAEWTPTGSVLMKPATSAHVSDVVHMAFRTWHLLICRPQVNVNIQSSLWRFCAMFEKRKPFMYFLPKVGPPEERFREIFGKPWAVVFNGFGGKEPVSKSKIFMFSLRWLDWIFWGGYLPSLSIDYVAMSKDREKRLTQLYYIKMKISYDLGFIAIGVAMAT